MWEKSKEFKSDSNWGNIRLIYDDGLKTDVHITLKEALASTDVIKVYLSSSSNPYAEKINGGLAEGKDKEYKISKKTDIKNLSAEDIDTAEIIRKNVFTEESEIICKILFKDDEPVDRLTYLREHPAYRAYLKEAESLNSPVENCAEALENLKQTLSKSNMPNANSYYMDEICSIAENFPEANEKLPPIFVWHKIDALAHIFPLSSFRHILSAEGVIRSFEKYYYYLLGINKNEKLLCIAVPIDADDLCPIPHVEDCCVYLMGKNCHYCTVCISLEQDGQYFMAMP